MYSLIDLPPTFRSVSLWNYRWPDGKPGEVLRQCLLTYMRGRASPSGIYLHGPSGVGKTHLLVSLYKVLGCFCHHGVGGVSLRFWRPMVEDCRSMVAERESWERACHILGQSTYLLIDDVKVDGEFEGRVLKTTIEDAYDQGARLLITSNLAPEVVMQQIDFHAASRLKAMCAFVHIRGADQR